MIDFIGSLWAGLHPALKVAWALWLSALAFAAARAVYETVAMVGRLLEVTALNGGLLSRSALKLLRRAAEEVASHENCSGISVVERFGRVSVMRTSGSALSVALDVRRNRIVVSIFGMAIDCEDAEEGWRWFFAGLYERYRVLEFVNSGRRTRRIEVAEDEGWRTILELHEDATATTLPQEWRSVPLPQGREAEDFVVAHA